MFYRRESNRGSIRLKLHDYSSPGFYFITIVIHKRECVFGEIVRERMIQSKAGEIAHKFWFQIPDRFEGVNCDTFVVMPNHIYGIIKIEENRPAKEDCYLISEQYNLYKNDPETYRKKRRLMLLTKIVGWYKMNTARNINLINNTSGRFWHRNYYEHVIRDEESLAKIRHYIITNPSRWEKDSIHPNNQGPPGWSGESKGRPK